MSLADMDGETLQRLAYEADPIEPKGLALTFIVVIAILFAICTVILALRIYVRAWMMRKTRGWAWDDTFAVLAYGAFLCSGVFGIRAAFFGLGTRDVDLNPIIMIRAAEYMLFANVLYGFSMPLVKAAVLFTMLPITTESKYRWLLYALQAISTLMSIIGVLASLLYCRPVPAYWNPLLGTCGNFMVVVNIGYAWTTIGIVTDIGFAAVPFFVVRKLQMTRRTKRTVTVILGFGVVACIATIVRAPYLQYYLVETDRLYWNGHITLWCLLETGLAMIATNLPPLRLLFINYLKSKNENSQDSKGSGGRSGLAQSHALVSIGGGRRNGPEAAKAGPPDTSHSDLEAGREGWDNFSDNSSSKAIMQQTTIQITSEERKQE